MQATSNSGPPSQDLQQENDLHKDALPGLTPQNSANLPQFTGSKRILGCLSERHYLRPEDPTPNGQKEYAQWQDPFRMSVLDFQHRALDKLAEVLSIYLKANGMIIDPKEHEDVNALLGYIQLNAEGFAQELETNNPNKLTLETMCETLRSARNAFAHQKYNKSLQSEENKCQKPLPPEYKTTRTFEHTTDVIDYCIDLTERVVEVISREKVGEAYSLVVSN